VLDGTRTFGWGALVDVGCAIGRLERRGDDGEEGT